MALIINSEAVKNAAKVLANKFQRPIALEPTRGEGGRSIDKRSLIRADIIISTTSAAQSKLIRVATGSQVSHAMLYIGSGYVVEAIGEGVVERKIEDALSDAILAVAYRDISLSLEQQQAIINYVKSQRGKQYDTFYAIFGDLEGVNEDKFFCSELIVSAYQTAGANVIEGTPQGGSPDNVIEAYKSGDLMYVGHLIAEKRELIPKKVK